MTLEVVSFQSEHFNNNGDQGNLELLVLLAKLSGIQIHNSGQSQIATADFVIFGDASRAALRFYEPGLLAAVDGLKQRLDEQKPTLLVGSSYEFFASKLEIANATTVQRVSDFASAEFQGETVYGYQNSDSDLPILFSSGAFIATKLYGPVLAYNPQLLAAISSALGITSELPEQLSQEIREIRKKLSLI